ncbi:hypothetical protein BDN70DRAFT_249011 [Pholiota conissans]|uniref:Uncharacterized protein n=1 Tax=Pholiota conissans TaxID=109636 RepID=A0A9P5YVV3_9AGAR|nr:hypothetical protein BDN70DRAFT_249011 [Pholiota conissans]
MESPPMSLHPSMIPLTLDLSFFSLVLTIIHLASRPQQPFAARSLLHNTCQSLQPGWFQSVRSRGISPWVWLFLLPCASSLPSITRHSCATQHRFAAICPVRASFKVCRSVTFFLLSMQASLRAHASLHPEHVSFTLVSTFVVMHRSTRRTQPLCHCAVHDTIYARSAFGWMCRSAYVSTSIFLPVPPMA